MGELAPGVLPLLGRSPKGAPAFHSVSSDCDTRLTFYTPETVVLTVTGPPIIESNPSGAWVLPESSDHALVWSSCDCGTNWDHKATSEGAVIMMRWL